MWYPEIEIVKDVNGDGVRDKDGVELILIYGTTTREIRRAVRPRRRLSIFSSS